MTIGAGIAVAAMWGGLGAMLYATRSTLSGFAIVIIAVVAVAATASIVAGAP